MNAINKNSSRAAILVNNVKQAKPGKFRGGDGSHAARSVSCLRREKGNRQIWIRLCGQLNVHRQNTIRHLQDETIQIDERPIIEARLIRV